MTEFRVKRIYDDAAGDDGRRLLVDRLWPRGISKEQARIDAWPREVTPSAELRKAFHAKEISHDEFAERYRAELAESGAAVELAGDLPTVVTLVTAVRDPEHSHLPVLVQALRAVQ